jgi:hypothetical protein
MHLEIDQIQLAVQLQQSLLYLHSGARLVPQACGVVESLAGWEFRPAVMQSTP